LEGFSEKDIKQYWKKKEDNIGEKISGKMFVEITGDSQIISGPIFGILFYTNNSFYFNHFPRKNWWTSLLKSGAPLQQDKLLDFCISWSDITKIVFPSKKCFFLGLFLPQDFRVFIDYQVNGNKMNLTIIMHRQTDRNKLIKFYKKVRNVT